MAKAKAKLDKAALNAAAFNTWRKLKQAFVKGDTDVVFKVPDNFKHPAEEAGHLNLPPEAQEVLETQREQATIKLPKSLEDYFKRNLSEDEVARFSRLANSLVEKLQSGEWKVEDVDLDTKAKELVLTVAEKNKKKVKSEAVRRGKSKPPTKKAPRKPVKRTKKS